MKCLLKYGLRIFTISLGIAVMYTVLFVGGHGSTEYKTTKWAFDGALGRVDRPAAQRGFQVYKEVCASCHGLRQVAYRNLSEIGFTEPEIKTIASSVQIQDSQPNEDGEMFMRPGKPSDKFKSPFSNENEARSANGGAYPPDLSLIVKARHDGANYLYSLLQGYDNAPECIKTEEHYNIYQTVYYSIVGHKPDNSCKKLAEGMSYNKYFGSTQQIAMPAPLFDGGVEYQDGTEATIEQQAKDVTVFLQWAAEPEMEQRKRIGFSVIIFLTFFTLLFYFAKKAVWKQVK